MNKTKNAKVEIPYKFPSLNDYTKACRGNAYSGANMKRKVQSAIGYFINLLPVFENPISINFTWIEGNGKRDPDNVVFAKKFILDAMVDCGKIRNDSRRTIVGFTDKVIYKKDEWRVIVEIREESEIFAED